MLGDFIHQLSVVKNICDQKFAKANLYLSEGYGGDVWRLGGEQAYNDLKEIIKKQHYINDFIFLRGEMSGDYINLNKWRGRVATTHSETGKYDTCWSELLSQVYEYEISRFYHWLVPTEKYKMPILLHRSKHRHNNSFDWEPYLKEYSLFVTTDHHEYEIFKHRDRCQLFLCKDISHMVNVINGCRLFVGNQSAPFAIANALDVPRICELDADPAPFYMGEEKYSNNIKWFLNDQKNNL